MKLREVLHKLEDCIHMVWVPYRGSGYSIPQLDRRKAAKTLREVVDNGLESGR